MDRNIYEGTRNMRIYLTQEIVDEVWKILTEEGKENLCIGWEIKRCYSKGVVYAICKLNDTDRKGRLLCR